MNLSHLSSSPINRLGTRSFILGMLTGLALVILVSTGIETYAADKDEDALNARILINIDWVDMDGNIQEKGSVSIQVSGKIVRIEKEGGFLRYVPDGMTATYNYTNKWFNTDPNDKCYGRIAQEKASGSRPVKNAGEATLYDPKFGLQVFMGDVGKAAALQFMGDITPEKLLNLIKEPPRDCYTFTVLVPFKTNLDERKGCRHIGASSLLRSFLFVVGLKELDQSGMHGSYTWESKTHTFQEIGVADCCGIIRYAPEEHPVPSYHVRFKVSWRFGKFKPIMKIWREGVDITDETEEVLVGEKIKLESVVLPETATINQGEWKIPGQLIEDFIVQGEKAYIDKLEIGELKKPRVKFHWWDSKDNLTVTYSAVVDGEKIEAKAHFVVKEPVIKMKAEVPSGDFAIGITPEGTKELLYDAQGKPTIVFTHDPLPPEFIGETQYVQLVATSALNQKHPDAVVQCMAFNLKGLDETYPYAQGPKTQDFPGVPVTYLDLNISVKHNFEMVLMYKPDEEDAIFVPLRAISWKWKGFAKRKSILDNFDLRGSQVSEDPQDRDAEKYPTWSKILSEKTEWTPCK